MGFDGFQWLCKHSIHYAFLSLYVSDPHWYEMQLALSMGMSFHHPATYYRADLLLYSVVVVVQLMYLFCLHVIQW